MKRVWDLFTGQNQQLVVAQEMPNRTAPMTSCSIAESTADDSTELLKRFSARQGALGFPSDQRTRYQADGPANERAYDDVPGVVDSRVDA